MAGRARGPRPGEDDRPAKDPVDDLLAARLRALAHPVRLALLRACMARERSAGELVEIVILSPAAVSEHLKVLRKTRLLVLEVRHRYHLYRADPEVVREIVAALEALTEGRGLGGEGGAAG
ncbi:MAG: ArsR/SmtB family transcription factor [Solirubrobacteraceae bacterium]